MKKPLVLIGHLSLLITAILAVVFFKERVLFVDPGQQLFEMINENGYKVFVHRYSMVINQTIPLIAIKLGLPLRAIMISYSLSFVFIFYLSFIISVYGFKNIAAGLSISLAPIFIRVAFGHSISEAWLGIAYSAVFYALLNYYDVWRKKGKTYIALFYALILLVVGINYFIHPITLFTVGFAVAFTYFYKAEYKRSYIYLVGLLVLVVYLHKFFFPSHPHEESFFEGIKNAHTLLPKIFTLPVLEFFRISFFRIYLPGILLLFISGFLFYKNRKMLSYLVVLGFGVFYTIIACLAFYKGDAPFALESRLIPLIFIIIIPVIEVAKGEKYQWIFSGMLSIILIYSFINLGRYVERGHTKRIAFYEKMLEKSKEFPERKFYVYLPDNKYSPVNSWGSAVETLLLSSLDGKEESRTIIFVNRKTDIQTGMNYWPCMFLWVPWYMFYPEENLSKKYFDLKCTPYRELIFPNKIE